MTYYKHLYANKFNSLDEIEKFLEGANYQKYIYIYLLKKLNLKF